MRFLLWIGLGLVPFAATVLGLMYTSGNLNREGIEKALSRKPPAAESVDAATDDAGPVARELQTMKQQLTQRESQVAEAEKRLKISQQHIDGVLSELQQTLEQILDASEARKKAGQAKLSEVAKSFESMNPETAASALESWPPDEVGQVLGLMDERKRGKILDKMEPAKIALILRVQEDMPL